MVPKEPHLQAMCRIQIVCRRWISVKFDTQHTNTLCWLQLASYVMQYTYYALCQCYVKVQTHKHIHARISSRDHMLPLHIDSTCSVSNLSMYKHVENTYMQVQSFVENVEEFKMLVDDPSLLDLNGDIDDMLVLTTDLQAQVIYRCVCACRFAHVDRA